jgi:hypothetical protein
MRKLVAIALTGVAIVGTVVYFGRSTETTLAPVIERENPQVPAGDASTPPVASPQTELASTDASEPRQPQLPTRNASAPAVASASSESTAPVTGPSADEKQQQAACDAIAKRQSMRERAARDAERKDLAWASSMEQKLHEYTTRRFRTSQIEVIGIDCKATYCDIRAQSFSPETEIEFDQGITAVRAESWNDFTHVSMSHTEEAGKTLYHAEVRRQHSYADLPEDPDEERFACGQLHGRDLQRERAARDAQPRDAGWADPTEQLIRQYLVAHTAKHPVEKLDVSCKTTFCQIKASGRGTESFLALQRAAQQVASEPWSDMRSGEGGTSGYGDKWKQDYILLRR